jgi:hypothetical protein
MYQERLSRAIPFAVCALIALAPRTGGATTVEELELRLNQLEGRLRRLEAEVGITEERPGRPPAQTQQSSPPIQTQNYIVPELMVKKIHGAGAGSEGELRFYLRLKNNFGRDVAGFEGLFVVEDLAGNRLLEFAASIQKAMASGNTVSWVGAIDIDSADKGHRQVMRGSKEDLALKLALKKVTFADGTTQTYDR